MFDSSTTNREWLVVGREDGVHRPHSASRLEVEEEEVEFDVEGDAEGTIQQWELLERICLAAGQTC